MYSRLDGLKEGPIEVGTLSEGVDWLSVAQPAVQARMGKFAASETHFALMRIVRRPINVLEESIR